MVLIIAEKPSVSGEIAKVVGATKREKGFWSGGDYLVSWCVGHLIGLAKPDAYDAKLAAWHLDTLPIIPQRYLTQVNTKTVDQYKVLEGLIHRADVTELIEATDAGREGELIFRLVYDQTGCTKPFRRLWISSIEEKSIRDGLKNAKDSSEYDNLYRAALCRQRADWLVGINFTRLYSKMYDKTLTCGRVQTPTVNLIVCRQREIESFVPQTYYTLIAQFADFKAYAKADTKDQAQQILDRCAGKLAHIAEVSREEKREKPAALYDLTTLQRDANRLLGYSAQQTLDYAQSLYDNKLASYPRTDSRYITADQERSTGTLIQTLLGSGVFAAMQYDAEKVYIPQIVNDKKVTDHHGLMPTGNVSQDKLAGLPTGERNILWLISYRLLSAVYAPHEYAATKVVATVEGEAFTATGREEISLGFKVVDEQLKRAIQVAEQAADKPDADTMLPSMAVGDTAEVLKMTAEEKKTKPPLAYTEDTLLSAMETAGKNIADQALKDAMKDSGLGTPATRAGIIEGIIKTGYIERKGKKLLPTDTACRFIDLVAEQVKEPELTADWERQLAAIERGQQSADDFMCQITGFVRSLVDTTKATFSPAQPTVFKSEKECIGTCPRCGQNVVEWNKCFSCQSGKDGCGFAIWKTIAAKSISKTQVAKLLTKGKTDLIRGFTSKAGKLFDACLTITADKTVGFAFPDKK